MALAAFLWFLNIAGLINLALAYTPQVKTTYLTKSAKGVSTLFWFNISLATSYSLYNTLISASAEWYGYLGQYINAGMALIFVVWIALLKWDRIKAIMYTLAYIAFNLILFVNVPLEVSQTVATIAIIIAYVDQIYHFIKTNSAEGTNPWLYFMFATGLTMIVIIMALTGVSIHVIITEVVNIILLIVCGCLSHKYKKE